MSISYIKGSAGLTSVDAAEKIKVNYVENLKRDPYLKSRLLPVASEGLTNGGGLYRFQTPLGKDVAVRRTGAPTSSTVDYTPGMNVEEVSLTVSQPFMTPTYVMEAGDVVQLDGINYSGILATQIVEALVEAEILNEEAGVVAASKTEKSVAASTALDKFKEIKKVIGHYANIDEANTF